MVKVTFEQNGHVEDVTSGEFVLAVINKPQKQSDGRDCILGQATDKDITLALKKLVEKTVSNAVSPEARATSYSFLLAMINVELGHLYRKEETPEAATSGESSK